MWLRNEREKKHIAFSIVDVCCRETPKKDKNAAAIGVPQGMRCPEMENESCRIFPSIIKIVYGHKKVLINDLAMILYMIKQ